MIRLTFILLILLNFSSHAQQWEWTRGFTSDQINATYSVTTDDSGNCYIAGTNNYKGIIAKYSPNGNLKFSEIIWNGTVNAIKCSNGYLYVAGDTGGGSRIAKYTIEGIRLWIHKGGPGSFNCLETDNQGNVYVAGDGSLIKKFDSTGVQSDSVELDVIPFSMDITSDGTINITGKFYNDIVVNGTLFEVNGRDDIFLTKLDSSLNVLWFKSMGSNSYGDGDWHTEAGNGLITDSLGNIYVTGSFIDTVSFDSHRLISQDGNDMFLAKYSYNGDCIWVTQGKGPYDQEGRCIAFDHAGNIVVGGSYCPNMTFGSNIITGWGNYDGFVSWFDTNGDYKRSIKLGGGSWNDIVFSLTITGSDELYLGGRFSQGALFGTETLGNSGGFVSRISGATGVTDFESPEMLVYPNPCEGVITIESSEQIRTVRLDDMQGRILQVHHITSKKFQLENIPKGMFLIEIHYSNGARITKKVIH